MESISARIAFTAIGCASTAVILYIFGSFQGVTDAGLIVLLRIIGWATGLAILMTLYSSVILCVLRFFVPHRSIAAPLVRNLFQSIYALLLFGLQSYILLMTQNV